MRHMIIGLSWKCATTDDPLILRFPEEVHRVRAVMCGSHSCEVICSEKAAEEFRKVIPKYSDRVSLGVDEPATPKHVELALFYSTFLPRRWAFTNMKELAEYLGEELSPEAVNHIRKHGYAVVGSWFGRKPFKPRMRRRRE